VSIPFVGWGAGLPAPLFTCLCLRLRRFCVAILLRCPLRVVLIVRRIAAPLCRCWRFPLPTIFRCNMCFRFCCCGLSNCDIVVISFFVSLSACVVPATNFIITSETLRVNTVRRMGVECTVPPRMHCPLPPRMHWIRHSASALSPLSFLVRNALFKTQCVCTVAPYFCR
jgi:hypothetical protein